MTSSLPPVRLPAVPTSRHTPNVISLQVEVMPNGGYRLSTPHARGWAIICQTPMQLAHAMPQAFTEVSVAAYARAKGAVYDLDGLTPQVPGDPLANAAPRRARQPRTGRRAAHSPADWAMTDTGKWRSPSGRLYGSETATVRRVKAKRRAMGLPT